MMSIFGRIILLVLFLSNSVNALSRYEKNKLNKTLTFLQKRIDLKPEGKTISDIIVVTLDPMEKEDNALTLLNNFHVNTKEFIVMKGLYFQKGDSYNSETVQDSLLTLKGKSIRGLTLIVPVRDDNTKKDEVEVLVLTKDIFSLRPSFSFESIGGRLDEWKISFGEHNLLGTNKSLAAGYKFNRKFNFFNIQFFDPYLFGSFWQLLLKPQLILSPYKTPIDGFGIDFTLKKPFLSVKDKYSYGISTSFLSRTYVSVAGDSIKKIDIPTTKEIEALEKKYYSTKFDLSLLFSRSFGMFFKREPYISYNFEMTRPSILQKNLTIDQEKYFNEKILPKKEIESYFTLGAKFYFNKYLYLYNYDSFLYSEIIRLGLYFLVASDIGLKRPLFSDENFWRPKITATYTQKLTKDSFARISSSGSVRYDGDFNDKELSFFLAFISPSIFKIGRLVSEGKFSFMKDNRNNSSYSLGANNGLRGVEVGYYSGTKLFKWNTEIRTSPLKIILAHIGLAFFYDVGAAFDDFEKANATHVLGLGIRAMMPEFSSEIFRLDLAIPITGKGAKGFSILPMIGFGQSF